MIILKYNGKPIAETKKPLWTCLQSNGYNVVTNRKIADGVVVNGTQYNLAGKTGNGYDTVQIEEIFNDAYILENVKIIKISKSKELLKTYLEQHPIKYNEKLYSVTENKQALLAGNLAAYQLAITLGQKSPELTWNATGEECTVWIFENLAALAVAIKAYVKPLVAYQQAYEVSVNACTSVDAINAIPLDYDSVITNAS